jgi:asparagine synthase (glutamine-hydrolysing)
MLVFGSELDQIIGHPMINAEIDPQSIFNYMYFHVIPSPGSIYRGISKLQPGECLEFNNGELSNYFYWQLTYTDSHYSKKELFAQLRAELEQSVSVCEPDLNTGVFLSGGLDSSTVAGFYKKITNRSIDAFTMGFDAEGYDEMAYARITAAHFKVNLHEYYVTPADVLQAIP